MNQLRKFPHFCKLDVLRDLERGLDAHQKLALSMITLAIKDLVQPPSCRMSKKILKRNAYRWLFDLDFRTDGLTCDSCLDALKLSRHSIKKFLASKYKVVIE